nr:MAG TPA: hypothetical protein [Caudoviricetes sp.]
MKKVEIELNELMEAPIDETNVLADALFDLLFDNSRYVWEGCQAVGFVNNIATIASYLDNILVVKIIPNNTSQEEKDRWNFAVVNSITGLELDNIEKFEYISFLNEDENIIFTYVVLRGVVEFQFHFNEE